MEAVFLHRVQRARSTSWAFRIKRINHNPTKRRCVFHSCNVHNKNKIMNIMAEFQ